MSTTTDGQGASEEELRAALEALVDRSPHWHEPNRKAITTLGPAITELAALRAEVAAQRPVVAAARRYEAVWQQVLDSVADGVLLLPPDHHNTRIQARQALFDALARATPHAGQE